MENEVDMFLDNPFFYDLLVTRMIKTLRSPTNKFIFTYVFLLGYKQKEAADALHLHETNISRRLKHIRRCLTGFKKEYGGSLGCKEK